ncbi:3-hydroxyacyl-CoA dehydrogenase [Marinicauda pacifica]|jgi:NAD(P)-dependent dehydrogenase (short-subunit alcohol dehydrogenase family)|uniref:SDR family NAD(P)-dependent oxidoreductase n=1 Tax=Marinicauda pacifica TaxID=1133559 RepID=A0A4S2HCD2_9PROT|nr:MULTISPECIES: SDR family NAD(P)-dependent oxidoreductase [Marinicauda]TGY93301.1 SDR family NAD(P)-dependent oxidoreductase [Marinicauda pacifica]GGE44609.1 3-hydroxyacyl-CoA dehydrogenase [Marinicauda pacifica]
MDVKDVAAIVTGGASGLGEGTARRLAAEGAKVALFDLNEERGEAVAKELGGIFCKVNVADVDSVEAGFAKAREAHGQERVLVNCAGIGWAEKTARRSSSGDIVRHQLDKFALVVTVNLIGSFNCAAVAAEGMLSLDPTKSGRGIIVNTASVAAQDGQIGQVAYAASKGGIYGMTLPMARDLAREGIRVNTILPGFFETPIYEQMPPEVKQNLASHLQFPQRFGTPEEYADLVAFMVGNDYINAECVRLDAGARMPPK